MDMEQIRTFLEIVQQGSFSKAACTLDIAQPTVSARIQGLEKEVGGALLVRGGQRLTLTELGETFLPYAQRLLATFADGLKAVHLAQTGQRGLVRIGTFTSLGATLLPDVIATFNRRYPDVMVCVRTGINREIILGLQEGTLELGHATWPWTSAPPEIVPILQFREPLICVVAADHPMANRHGITLEEFAKANIPFFHLGSGQLYHKITSLVDLSEGSVNDVPLATGYELVLRGIGCALYTSSLVAKDLDAGRLVPLRVIDAEPNWRYVALVRNIRRGSLSQIATNFVSVFQQEVERTSELMLV